MSPLLRSYSILRLPGTKGFVLFNRIGTGKLAENEESYRKRREIATGKTYKHSHSV